MDGFDTTTQILGASSSAESSSAERERKFQSIFLHQTQEKDYPCHGRETSMLFEARWI